MITQKKLALIADNNLSSLRVLNLALSNLDYMTEHMAHFSQVVGMQNEVDVIFIEINMTVLGGYEFLKRLRKMGFNNPIIAHVSAILELEKVLKTWIAFVASTAAKALGQIGHKSAIDPLLEVLADPKYDVSIRTAAAEALGNIGHYSTIEELKTVLTIYVSKYKNDCYNLIKGYERGLFTTAVHALRPINNTHKAKHIAMNVEKLLVTWLQTERYSICQLQ